MKLERFGIAVLRYGLVLLLGVIGAMKFFDFEAQAIRQFVEHSPLLSWMYPAFGVRGASALIGVGEVAAALAIAARPWSPRASAYGSLAAAATFVVTLSFLVTTPNAPIGFLMKDVILLGAALYTAGEALAAAPQRRSSAASRPSRTVSQTSPAMHHLARR